MMARICAFLAIAYLLGGCVANTPKDLSLVSVEVVDFKEQAELHYSGSEGIFDPYRRFISSILAEKQGEEISAGDIGPYFFSSEMVELQQLKEQRPIFRIEFQTNRNLAELNYSMMRYTLGFDPYFCDQPDAPISWGHPGVYWDGLYLTAPLNYSIERELDGQFIYYAFMEVFDEFNRPHMTRRNGHSISHEKFDGYEFPADICFRVRGGSMGFGYRSNVVVIPKATIIEALEQMPQALQRSTQLR